jgi:D-threo-aldose 1-dehydrogenase
VLARAQRLDDVCRTYGVALAAVATQFAFAHPVVVSASLGARDRQQQDRNAELFETSVPDALWDDLRTAGLIREDAPTPQA